MPIVIAFDSMTPTDQMQDEVHGLLKRCHGKPDCKASVKLHLIEHLEKLQKGQQKEVIQKLKHWKSFVVSVSKPLNPKPNPPNHSAILSTSTTSASGYGNERKIQGAYPPLAEPTVVMSHIHELMAKLLFEPDHDALTILYGAVAAHGLPGKPVWLQVISPASGGKTEHILSLRKVHGVVELDSLTPKTFLSGMKNEEAYGGVEPSLLLQHDKPVFTFPDFSSVLGLTPHDRAEVFSQLLRVYDGHLVRHVGTGKPLNWTGRVTLISGITPVIYSFYKMMSTLGPRFLFLNIHQSHAQTQAEWTMQQGMDEEALQDEMQSYAEQLFESLPYIETVIGPADIHWYASLGNLVSYARSLVNRDHDHDIEDIPGRELPGRVTKQLKGLALGIARLMNHLETGAEERRLCLRVGLDTIPPLRRHILLKLYYTKDQGAAQAREGSDYSQSTLERSLEDLTWLGLVEGTGMSGGQVYNLRPLVRTLLTTLIPSTV
jgi:hypothetical protein